MLAGTTTLNTGKRNCSAGLHCRTQQRTAVTRLHNCQLSDKNGLSPLAAAVGGSIEVNRVMFGHTVFRHTIMPSACDGALMVCDTALEWEPQPLQQEGGAIKQSA